MPLCSGIKRDGGRCTVSVVPGERWCWHHSPERAQARRKAASKAGKSRQSGPIKELHELLRAVSSGVISGRLSPYQGVSVAQLTNARIRLLEHERESAEQTELIERLDRLEQGESWSA